jgi:hypothetical protein
MSDEDSQALWLQRAQVQGLKQPPARVNPVSLADRLRRLWAETDAVTGKTDA